MIDFAHPWAEYSRLQNDLSSNFRVSDRSWGLEEGLNCILWFDQSAAPLTQTEISRAVASRERSERLEPYFELAIYRLKKRNLVILAQPPKPTKS